MNHLRELPNSNLAERACLGVVLLDPDKLNRIEVVLTAPDFYRPAHRKIYQAMGAAKREGSPIDPSSLAEILSSTGDLEHAGGYAYIASLTDGVPRSANVEYHARIIAEKAQQRRFIEVAGNLVAAASNSHTDGDLQDYIRDLQEVAASGPVIPCSGDLYGTDVGPRAPEFVIPSLIRKRGLHMVWAAPGTGKTHVLLHLEHHLLLKDPGRYLFDHPDLVIRQTYERVLFITTEEDASELRFVADTVLRGLDRGSLRGEVRHIWASNPRRRITLDDLPSILEYEGPFDSVVLDSLTGLRPRTVQGRRVQWDLDNDAANDMCLRLRGLTEQYQVALMLVHHTGRDTAKGYRGPTDWWASADVQIGLVAAEAGKIKVLVEKVRGGGRPAPFLLKPDWGPDGFTLTYVGAAATTTLKPTEKSADAFLIGKRRASQTEIMEGADIRTRTTMRKIANSMIDAGRWRRCVETIKGSPVYEHVADTVGVQPSSERPDGQ